MNGSRNFQLVLLVTINFLFNSSVNAGVVERSIRMVREVYPPDIEPDNEGNQAQVCIVGDVVYGAEETVPAEQPCLKCRCQPPGVQCETVQCAKKPGCKAIHRSNKCCPDYQCECEHNGKIYANGEKLEINPGGECKVCYCRGGEVQCAEVSCYIRNDCEGKRVPGTCCPKYDHCPPIDAVFDRSSVITEPPPNTLKPIVLELWQGPNTTETPVLTTINSNPEDSNKVPDTSYLATASPSYEEIPQKKVAYHPRITIQEIIPERKEIPVTAPPKIFISEPQGTLLIEESLPTSENTSNDLNIDSEPESSEITEVFQHPPPVLRIGDKLLFLKKGDLVPEKDTSTSDSIITIIGAEGLQRGGVEESLEVHEVKIEPETEVQEIKNDEKKKVEIEDHESQNPLNITNNNGLETIYELKEATDQNANLDTNDLELKPAESTHILSLVKRKDKTMTTTTTQAPTTQKEDGLTTLTSSIDEPRRSEPQAIATESTLEVETTVIPGLNETKDSVTSTTISISTEMKTEVQTKSTEPTVEQNPAYPPIPDIMPAVGDVSQKFEVELENDNSTTMEIKILPEVFDFLSNNTKNETHSEWLKFNKHQNRNDTLIAFKAATLPDELLNQKSPIDQDEEDSTNTAEEATVLPFTEENIDGLLKETITSDPDVESLAVPVETTTEQRIRQTGSEEKAEKSLLEKGAQLIAEVHLLGNDFEIIKPSTESPKISTSIVSEPLDTVVNKSLVNNTDTDAKEVVYEFKSEPKKEFQDTDKTNLTSEEISTHTPKSIESLEIDSGEQTTPKTSHSSMLSNENASVETIPTELKTKSPSETHDMTQTSASDASIELGSVEISDNSSDSLLEVEMIGAGTNNIQVTTEGANVIKQDVELINVDKSPNPTKLSKIETSTYELLPTPEEAKSKTLLKREIVSTSATPQEDIFKDLEKELSAETSESTKSPEEERSEADRIFKELLDETNGKVAETSPKSMEQEKVNSLGDALAGIALKGKIPDPNVFRLIGGLLGGQRE